MTTTDALNILDQATKDGRFTRRQHELIVEALNTLEAAVATKEEPANDTAADR